MESSGGAILCWKHNFTFSNRRTLMGSGLGWPTGHEPNTAGDEQDARPSESGDLFMQYQPGEQGNHDVSDSSCREHIGQVRPRKCSEICRKKADEQQDPQEYQWMKNSQDHLSQVVQRDRGNP